MSQTFASVNRNRQKSTRHLLLLPLTILAGLHLVGCSESGTTANSQGTSNSTTVTSTKQVDKDTLSMHVQSAIEKYEQSLLQRTASINRFIQSRMSGVPAFAEGCTGWWAKYKTIRGQGEVYVKQLFSEKIFSDADLAHVLQKTIEDSVKDLEQIENELAIALEQEIIGGTLTEDRKQLAIQSFRDSMANLRNSVAAETGQAVASMVASEIVSYLTVQTLTSLGVSAGALATGTVFSWWTFGASIVVAVGFDYLWNWFDDPAGDIKRETNNQLRKMSQKLTSTVQGELGSFLDQRAKLWEKIVETK